MHRFFIERGEATDSLLRLSERETHHALKVLRIRAGEKVVALDGHGLEYKCETGGVEQKRLTLKVLHKNSHPPLPYQITLLQAIPKGKTMDLIVQKAAELGAHRVIPLNSDRTVAQVDKESAEDKVEKWQATAIEAIKQCGSAWMPTIETPRTPQAFLNSGERFDVSFIASLQPDARHPRTYFNDLARLPVSVAVWVGPEGDFTPAEINSIKTGGAVPITLGPLVLRSETAAIYALSALNYELQAPRS